MGSVCSRRAQPQPGAGGGASVEQPPSVPRTSDEAPREGERVVWQWCRHPEKVRDGTLTEADWGEYDGENSDLIERAFRERRREVDIYVLAHRYVVKLDAKADGFNFPRVQWCPTYRNCRGVRRVLAPAGHPLLREPSRQPSKVPDDVCAICYQHLKDPLLRSYRLCSLECTHTFHVVCLNLHKTEDGGKTIRCPLCCRVVPRPKECAGTKRRGQAAGQERSPDAGQPADEALLFHADRGQVDRVRAALVSGADVNTRMPRGTTPLMMAALNGHLAVVEVLVEKGARVDAKDDVHKTALWYAAYSGFDDVVSYLYRKGASLDTCADSWRARDMPSVQRVLRS